MSKFAVVMLNVDIPDFLLWTVLSGTLPLPSRQIHIHMDASVQFLNGTAEIAEINAAVFHGTKIGRRMLVYDICANSSRESHRYS